MSRSNINESDYRKIDKLSYSDLKNYDTNRIKFYKTRILGEKEVIDSDYIRMGNIIDVKKTDNDNFDNYFVITTANKPTGQLLTFTEFLFKLKVDDEKAEKEADQLYEEAYKLLEESNGGKVRDKLETFKKNFNDKAAEYFAELVKSLGKTVITLDEATMADAIIKKLDSTKALNRKGEIISKFPIMFDLNGRDMKCEVDEMVIDHDNKIIYPYDYKVTNFIESFVWDCYLKLKYYLQASLYKFAIQRWAIENHPGYKVENMAFKVLDYNNYCDPLLYQTTDKHYDLGFSGFYAGASYKKGINQILKEIDESIEMDNWGISPENYQNNNIVLIPEFKSEKDGQ